jgi:hypothetical protein
MFVAATARDETTGARVTLEPFHREIVGALTSAKRAAVEAFAEAGKSSLVAPVVAWMLGRDPTLRVGLVSNTLAQSTRQLGGVARLIEGSDAQRIFPTLRPSSSQWTQHALSIANKPSEIRDPNVQAASLDGASLLGSRLDVVIADDLDSLATTSTPAARDATWRWFVATVLSRLAPGGRVVVLSTTWHAEDTLHRFVALGGVEHVRIPIERGGRSSWPARWTAARIATRRRELGARVSARVLDCNPLSDDACVFEHALVQAMMDRGLAMPPTIFDRPRGRVVVGVDVGFSTGPTSDKSAIVVVRVCEDGRREVVHVEAARLDFDTLSARVVQVCNAFGGTAAIESNGGGGFVYQQVRKRAPAVALHTSQTSKAARVEMLHAEMSAARWAFRPVDGRMTDEMRALADGLVSYAPTEHTDDRVAALLVAVEQLRAHENRPKAGMFTVLRDGAGRIAFRPH